MQDFRPENRDLNLFSKIIAKPEDILFTPSDNAGKYFLRFRRRLLEEQTRHWANRHAPGTEPTERQDIQYLENLEPTAWKDQDHYAVLGLGHLRFRASEDDVRKAYRQRCLRHHPDKRMGAGQVVNPDGDYFACIVSAFEILGNPIKRRSYDSVDPKFDDYIPPKVVTDFFREYGNWFALNSRWSNKEPVPLLGNMSSPREYVDAFYSFWYDFDSWREYSYLDEEEKEKGSYREERRWIDKQNKAARAKRKKEEMARIRSVVDTAYAADPRVRLFKQQDLQKKQEYKQAKRNAFKQKEMEEESARLEAEQKANAQRQQEEEEIKERESKLKKEKEATKKAFKKERKTLRTLCKDNNYYSTDEKTKLDNMTHMENLCEILPLPDLEKLNEQLSKMSLEEGTEAFNDNVQRVIKKIATEKAESTKRLGVMKNGHGDHGVNGNEDDWDREELAMLIKAVNLFPAGTNQRWEVIATFIHQHQNSQNGREPKKRSAKDVLRKAKDLNSSDYSKNPLKKEINDQAFNIFQKNVKAVPTQSDLSKREDPADQKKEKKEVSMNGQKGDELKAEIQNKEWTSDEQKLLEQALKTYTSADPERWAHIAACIPGRSKKDCMTRFKELAAIVKAKKTAQQLNGKA